jgi:hypothetical protein
MTNSGTIITVYEGVTPLDFTTGTAGVGQYTISRGYVGSISLGSITAVGTSPVTAVVADGTGMSSNQVVITYTINGIRALGDTFTSVTTQTLTKANAGTDGVNGEAAGVVYAGDWKLTKTDGSTLAYDNTIPYISTSDLTYVVKHSDSYYICEDTHRYAGAFDSGEDYQIGDVVLDSGNYYLATIVILSGDTYPGDSGFLSLGSSITPGTTQTNLPATPTNPTPTSLWASFGAEFTSVATDILFAEDVYANRTINVGTGENNKPVISLNADTANDSASPFISIGQSTQAFEEDGIFLGFPSESRAPVLSLVSGSEYFIYNDGVIALSNAAIVGSGSSITGPSLKIGLQQTSLYPQTDARAYNFSVSSEGIVSASEANIRGTIEASAGNIGQWTITPPETDVQGNSIGGILQDNDGEIRFNPNSAEIQIYSASFEETSIEAPISMSVTVANSQFYIDIGDGAALKPELHLERSLFLFQNASGDSYYNDGFQSTTNYIPSYYFDLSDSTLSGHQFSFSLRQDGVGTYGGRYNRSTTIPTSEAGQNFLIITSSAAPGSTGAYIQITPSGSMTLPGIGNGLIGDPDGMEFWYYCENHIGMGNSVNIYDINKAVILDPTYTERVTLGTQNEFTDTAGASGNFNFTQTSQTLATTFTGVTTTNNWGGVDTTTVNQYSAFSANQALDAGPITLTDIVYPSIHVNSTGISTSTFTSSYPNYQPSYDGQVHGGSQMFYNLNAGYRSIYQYMELWNDDTGTIVTSVYLNGTVSYGAENGTHIWVADDDGGYGIQSVIGTTEITLEDGTTKLAKDITLNDRILSWDSNNDNWVSARVSAVKKRNVSEVYKVTIDNNVIEVSDTHGFWLFGNEFNSGQISAKELYKNKEAGSPMTQDSLKLWVKDGDSKKKVSITNIRKVEKDIEVITFSVPNYVNYVSNNIISHNNYGTLSWYQSTTGYASSASGVKTAASGTKARDVIIPSSGNYKIRFRISLTSKARMTITLATNYNATQTLNFYAFSTIFDSDKTTTGNSSANAYVNGGYTSTSMWNGIIGIQKNNNFVEILPAGIQVVSGTGRFTRLSRREQNSYDVELLEVIDGSVKIQSRNSVSSGTSFDDKLAIEADGNIMPETTDLWDLGSTSYNKYWRNLYVNRINSAPIDVSMRTMVAGGVFTQSTNNSSPSVSNSFNISSVTRTAEGVYTVNLSNTTNFSVSAGYVIAQGYGISGDTASRTPGDNEFVITWGTKVDGSTVNISSGDNDTNSRRDFYKCYFTFWSR